MEDDNDNISVNINIPKRDTIVWLFDTKYINNI